MKVQKPYHCVLDMYPPPPQPPPPLYPLLQLLWVLFACTIRKENNVNFFPNGFLCSLPSFPFFILFRLSPEQDKVSVRSAETLEQFWIKFKLGKSKPQNNSAI